MSVFLQPIYTQTVGAGGVSSITFNNIPQTFTDLKVEVSARATDTSYPALAMDFNGNNSASYSRTTLYNASGSVGSSRNSTTYFDEAGNVPGTGTTSNTFGIITIYIHNYTSSNYKTILVDNVGETNGTSPIAQTFLAGLWRQTAAVTKLDFGGMTFAQYTTFSLYGILRQGI